MIQVTRRDRENCRYDNQEISNMQSNFGLLLCNLHLNYKKLSLNSSLLKTILNGLHPSFLLCFVRTPIFLKFSISLLHVLYIIFSSRIITKAKIGETFLQSMTIFMTIHCFYKWLSIRVLATPSNSEFCLETSELSDNFLKVAQQQSKIGLHASNSLNINI